MIRKEEINIPRKFFHINLLIKSAIEKDSLDIKFPKKLFVSHSKRRYYTNNASLDDMTKGVSIVKVRYLSVAFSN